MQSYVIRYPGCIWDEVEPAFEILPPSAQLAILDLHDIQKGMTADLILLPGGNCDQAIAHAGLHDLIRKTHRSGGLLAGICNGALVIASAGVMCGSRCTHHAHSKYAPLPEFKELLDAAEPILAGSIYVDEDVVVDRNIITAKPKAKIEFARAILAHLPSRSLSRGL